MDLIVETPHQARWGGHVFQCATGKNGVADAAVLKEGDKTTPRGRWPMREVLYRPDRLPKPETKLPLRALKETDGWCDLPSHPDYNKFVQLPHPGVIDEQLWCEGPGYDVIVVIGHNDDPIVPGAGSAIFLHIARPDFSPTAGCVALRQEDLLIVLKEADNRSCVVVK